MLICISAGALLQQLLPAWSVFGGAKLPVLTAFVAYYALRCDPREMWLVVVLAALLHDGLELGAFGPALLAFPVIGALANQVRNEVFADGVVTQMAFGALAAVFTTVVTIAVYAITGHRPIIFGYAVLRLFGALLMGLVTLPLVSQLMNKLEASLPKRRGYGWQ
jgi:cell shape-determining protein MreD